MGTHARYSPNAFCHLCGLATVNWGAFPDCKGDVIAAENNARLEALEAGARARVIGDTIAARAGMPRSTREHAADIASQLRKARTGARVSALEVLQGMAHAQTVEGLGRMKLAAHLAAPYVAPAREHAADCTCSDCDELKSRLDYVAPTRDVDDAIPSPVAFDIDESDPFFSSWSIIVAEREANGEHDTLHEAWEQIIGLSRVAREHRGHDAVTACYQVATIAMAIARYEIKRTESAPAPVPIVKYACSGCGGPMQIRGDGAYPVCPACECSEVRVMVDNGQQASCDPSLTPCKTCGVRAPDLAFGQCAACRPSPLDAKGGAS